MLNNLILSLSLWLAVENVQLSLVLQTENKGSVVAGGELNVCLDGLVVDLGSLPNGSAASDSKFCSQTHMNTSWKAHAEHRKHEQIHIHE